MANVVVVGSQWGDEGKGKIVDWLCERADVVVRFQGEQRRPHAGRRRRDLQAEPVALRRGAARQALRHRQRRRARPARASGRDRAAQGEQGVSVTRESLRISDNATLILSLHRELDALREEEAAPGAKIGTTKRGIGPAYEDKVGRRAVRVMDLADAGALRAKIDRLLVHHNALRRGLSEPEIDPATIHEELTSVAERIRPFVDTVWALLDRKRREKRILFEGARGLAGHRPRHLSVRHLLQHRRRARPRPARGCPGALGFVLGIAKAYTTRVGEGPFPTEETGEIGEHLGARGANSAP